jgi:hypothetical protein
VFLVNSDPIDKLKFVVLSSIPLRARILGASFRSWAALQLESSRCAISWVFFGGP